MVDATSGVELCRVTVVAPRTRMDLALPAEAPLADLLPTLLRHAGENPDEPAFLRTGWVLQRLGETALDPSQRLSVLGVRDGDVLYLRHRESALPEFSFDDVADAISTATRSHRPAWQPSDTRRVGLVASGLFFVVGALVALGSGPPWTVPTVVMLVAGVGLVLGGVAMSRAFSQAGVGAYLGACGVAYGALGGLLALGGDKPLTAFGPPHLLMACALALVLATLAAFGIVAGWDGFFGAGAAATIGALACVIRLAFDTDAPAAAAIAVAVALAIAPFVPTFAARLARLPIPQLPTGADDLRRQTDVLPGPTVLQQAITADRLVAALMAATTAVAVIASVFLIRDDNWFGPALTGVMALALLLRARHFLGRTQRLWLIWGGIACAFLLVFRLVTDQHNATVLLIVGLPCLVVAAALGAWAVTMPGRRVSPYWARTTDLFEVVVLLSVVPLTLGVVGVYQMILEWLG